MLFSTLRILFVRDTIERMKAHFITLIQSIVTESNLSISQLNILPKEEKEQLLKAFQGQESEIPEKGTLVDLFESQAHKRSR